MQWFLVILFVVVVGALVFVAKTMKRSASSGTVDPYTELEQGPHVRYRVPDGQDPVVVLSRLREAGYTAVPDQGSYEQSVVIGLLEDTAQARDALGGWSRRPGRPMSRVRPRWIRPPSGSWGRPGAAEGRRAGSARGSLPQPRTCSSIAGTDHDRRSR